MFGNESLPSCIFEYDVFDRYINKMDDYLTEQLSLKCQYRNFLVAKKDAKLKLIEKLRLETFPKYNKIHNNITDLEKDIEEIYFAIKTERQKQRNKFNGTDEQKQKIKELKTTLKKLRTNRKNIKISMKEDKIFNQKMNDLESEYSIIFKKLYAEFRRKGLNTSTTSQTRLEVKYDSKCHNFNENGTLYFQFQKNKTRPALTWDSAIGGKDNRIKIETIKKNIPQFHNGKLSGYKEKEYTCVKVRTETGDKDKPAVWIEKLIYMDRPIVHNLCFVGL